MHFIIYPAQAVAEYNTVQPREADRKTTAEWCEHVKQIWARNQKNGAEKYTPDACPDVLSADDSDSSQEDYDSYTDESGDSYTCPF